MSWTQYNSLMSNLLNEKQALTKLRAELEGQKEKICWYYKKFRHLAWNYKNKKGKEKRKPVPQNKFAMLASRVMQYEVRKEVVRRQEKAKTIQCFKYREKEH